MYAKLNLYIFLFQFQVDGKVVWKLLQVVIIQRIMSIVQNQSDL